MFIPQDIIRKKRNREELTQAEIGQFVRGVTDGSIDPSQIGAFTMAIYLNGMNSTEQAYLTFAMRDSGTVLTWELLPPSSRVIEKHSSGGVGDEKVTLIVVALVAACGVYSPNISGRSLGHTGGELDLLESIPGYQIRPAREVFQNTVSKIGTAIIGPTEDLAPADRAIFHVRDVTATVESIPLIVSSILSKKLASGAQGLVMTVPFGSGAFMARQQDSVQLAQALINVARVAGLPMIVLVSDLDEILGDSIGNALQIVEVIEFLKGERLDSRLHQVVMNVASEIVKLAGVAESQEAAKILLDARLNDQSGAKRFAAMVAALGGPADLIHAPARYLETAEIVAALPPLSAGVVQSMDCYKIGMALVKMGAGRTQPGQQIDYSIGINRIAHVGDAVHDCKPLCILHARNQDQWNEAARTIQSAFTVGSEIPLPLPVIVQRLTSG